jgi:hypothetical protein
MKSARINREMMTVRTMIGMYCRNVHHPVNGICGDCKMLIEYSEQRTEKCRFGKDKPICAKCPVHCYKQEMRMKIREVMRYSGPRMIYHHPYLAFMHVIDKNRFKKFKINE